VFLRRIGSLMAFMNNAIPSLPGASSADHKSAASGISVIIPAYNAEATLEVTLNSVLLQTHTIWEAVICDDGSTDGTQVMAQAWACRDRRFRVLHQKNSGVSTARNTGLREARYPFVLFLDSDDRIDPTHLERMAGMLVADPTLDAVHCGWRRILPSGVLGPARTASYCGDLFEYFAYQCCFPIHACVLKRDLALGVGGFDGSLTTCEDWDFFQRVARTGARFGRVPEDLAFYQVRANSASQDSRRCLSDARVVLDRGHGRDPRIGIAAQVHVEGRDRAYLDLALYYTVAWLAAQEIGNGRDGLDLLDANDFTPAPDLLPEIVADVIQEHFAADWSVQDWPALWRRLNAPLAAFLAKLEARTGAAALAFATLRHLEKKLLLANPDQAPLVLASTYRVSVELARRIPDVFLPPEADRLICLLTLKGEPIGVVELPGTDVVTGRRIAKAALEGRKRLTLRLLIRSALTSGRGFYACLATVRDLLRRRTFRLLWNALVAKRKDRLSAARRLAHEVAGVIATNLPGILAACPGRAARRAESRWQQCLDAFVASGRAHARERISNQNLNGRNRVAALPLCMAWMTPSGEMCARRQGRRPISQTCERACSVPILVYHRIAAGGPVATERFRVTPDNFESQISTLYRAGYRTIGLGEWVSAMVRHEPLPGKPVILTFDDGYQDFLTAAVPVLQAHGFSATVFLVAERIGGTADWDAEHGEPAPLLSWEEVHRLQEIGIEFGCHSSVHRPMTVMRFPELAEDAVRARAILQEGLGTAVTTLAYPYGAVNEFVCRAIEDLGFKSAVSCEPGISRFGDNPLRLPRIEVRAGCTPERLLAWLDDGLPAAARQNSRRRGTGGILEKQKSSATR
jgi:glycosyltransferase involved in cell wall biosynthesis/peptidoglycan/xylan/chitin deacetylase (PgdA/CDA1 family)